MTFKIRSLKLFCSTALALATASVCKAADAPTQPTRSNRIVVMISLDGLAGYYLDDPKADMPTLRELAKEGARASGMKASTPSVTWPNHTTLVTGDNPARHGVVGNNFWDRAADKRVTLIGDPVFDKDQIVKVPTIYDVAKNAGLITASIRWPATRGAKTLDWTVPSVKDAATLIRLTTPALRTECEAAGLWSIEAASEGEGDDKAPNDKAPDGKAKGGGDGTWTTVFNLILAKHRPQLALLHLATVDHTEHLYGPRTPEAYAACKRVDDNVKDVWAELKKDYADEATLVIVSDHGFSPIEKQILPNVILRDADLVKVKGLRIVSGQVRAVVQGGSTMIYVTDEPHRADVMAKVRKAFTGVEGVERVIGSEDFAQVGMADPKVDPHSPDMIVQAKEGYSFGDTAAGALTFQEKPEKKGSHGHDADLPDLHATFIAWGKGIKPGTTLGEVRNIDVAPTLAKLLHVEMPNTDGKPINAALSN